MNEGAVRGAPSGFEIFSSSVASLYFVFIDSSIMLAINANDPAGEGSVRKALLIPQRDELAIVVHPVPVTRIRPNRAQGVEIVAALGPVALENFLHEFG